MFTLQMNYQLRVAVSRKKLMFCNHNYTVLWWVKCKNSILRIVLNSMFALHSTYHLWYSFSCYMPCTALNVLHILGIYVYKNNSYGPD